ncbi:MAG: homoserine dehydrogenase [Firmicutes bacterium]|nr:homoserine dehydrogenase [Bacillota bacterium]
MPKEVNIGILGLGVVGTGVAKILLEQKKLLTERTGVEFRLKTVVDLDWERDRGISLDGIRTTTDFEELVQDPEIEVVVETMGGIEPAFSFVMSALAAGKHVVTANKALIALKGRELLEKARECGVQFLFEASVGGGIPIIKSLREGLIANKILRIYGIINGTSNYILTKMHQEGLDFSEALQEAQAKGFAEADPTLDVGGGDAAHKLTILASLAAGGFVDFGSIPVEGITELTSLDINFAKNFGYVIKLLAICRFNGTKLDLRVHPTLVPGDHLLAAVNHELNAIFVTGNYVGDTMFYGPGAGQSPTASAVVSDLVDLARAILQPEGGYTLQMINPEKNVALFSLDEIANRYYLRFFTLDQPGILAKISGVFGKYGISISSVVQLETHGEKNYVPIVLLTHEAPEKAMFKALDEIKKFDFVRPDLLRLRLFK